MKLKEVYSLIEAERGGLAAIHTSFSAFPEGIMAHYQFYKSIMLNDGLPLERADREHLAVEVSKANACPQTLTLLTQHCELSGADIFDRSGWPPYEPCRLTDLELSGAPQLATREAERRRPTRPLERLVSRQATSAQAAIASRDHKPTANAIGAATRRPRDLAKVSRPD